MHRIRARAPEAEERLHHLVLPPGGLVSKQSLQRCFWFVERNSSSAFLLRFSQATAALRRKTKSSRLSKSVGRVSNNLSRRSFQAFSMALKSWEQRGYPGTSLANDM